MLRGCIGGAEFHAGTAATLRHIAQQGSSRLYPRPPFKGDALQTAADIDSWVDFSGTTLAKAVREWESSGSAKVLPHLTSAPTRDTAVAPSRAGSTIGKGHVRHSVELVSAPASKGPHVRSHVMSFWPATARGASWPSRGSTARRTRRRRRSSCWQRWER